MKRTFLILLFLEGVLTIMSSAAQNVSINVLTQNAGLVSYNGTVFVEITIANTSSTTAAPSYKLRPQLSVPISIANISATGHTLPTGWSIISNATGVIRVSNGTDQIPPNTARTLLIAIQGNTIGGPQTVSGNLLFSNGVAPGSASGPATGGDLTADNSSSSTVQVYDPIPLTLRNFNAIMKNCQTVLNWSTENEINSGRFEIERSNLNYSDWKSIGVVTAKGNTSIKSEYNFIDKTLNASSQDVVYRLKMIDKDGQFKYSEVVFVSVSCNNTHVNVYPNPVQNGRLNISITGTVVNSEATLLSISGQLMLKTKITNGINYVNTSTIADGVYILNIIDANGSYKKVVVTIQQ